MIDSLGKSPPGPRIRAPLRSLVAGAVPREGPAPAESPGNQSNYARRDRSGFLESRSRNSAFKSFNTFKILTLTTFLLIMWQADPVPYAAGLGCASQLPARLDEYTGEG